MQADDVLESLSPVPVATGLHFPTSLAFAPDGAMLVAESGLPFAGAPPRGRVWRVEDDGRRTLLGDELAPPVNGLLWQERGLVVSEGGAGRLTLLGHDGERRTLVEGLPGPGNYHLNMAVEGPDGLLYFSVGAMTNMGIVGLDSYEIGWLARLPHAHDVPGYDIVVGGQAVETPDPLHGGGTARTGAFAPFGSACPPGTRIAGETRCTAAVLRCRQDGSGLEVVAWGLRNAYGLGFLPDGRLLAVDQGPDDRGSRPVGEAPDLLYEVREGAWYGWPDYVGGVAVTDPRFRPRRGPAPTFVLTDHAALPPAEQPLVEFAPHAAAVKFDLAPAASPWPGRLVVALFGDEAPMTAPDEGVRTGRALALVDPVTSAVERLAVPGLTRPIDVRFSPDGLLHVLDFGRFEMTESGVAAEAGTGAIWRAQLAAPAG
jgi:glucose/arabinose dehydrogenase